MAIVGMTCVIVGVAIGVVASGSRGTLPSEEQAPVPMWREAYGDVLPEPPALVSEEVQDWPETSLPAAADEAPEASSLEAADAPALPPPPETAPLAEAPGGEEPAAEQPAGAPLPDSDVEVLTRGPVHEALTEMIAIGTADAAETIAAEEPPQAVEEIPPDDRPSGQDIAWIPGYWSWDDEDLRYIWVSGLWRRIPAGCRWVPGYWQCVAAGRYQWASGFWVATSQAIKYLPPPPESPEAGPGWQAPAAPGADLAWVPGHWERIGARYVWQDGYWMELRPDRVWVPAHYQWTPHGYIFVPGYWDYPLEERGIFFAPVAFRHAGAGICYRPSIVIELRLLTVCLFSRPRDRHYYFGDYFEARYRNRGIYPWFEHHEHGIKWHDPAYDHCRIRQLRGDRRWEERLRADFKHRSEHPEARPARTYVEPAKRVASRPAVAERAVAERRLALGVRLSAVVEASKAGQAKKQFEPVDPARRRQLAADQRSLREYAEARKKLEAAPRAPQQLEARKAAGPSVAPPRLEVKRPAEAPVAPPRPEPKKRVETPAPGQRPEAQKPTASPVIPQRPETRKAAAGPAPAQHLEPAKPAELPIAPQPSEPRKSVAAPVALPRPEPGKLPDRPAAAKPVEVKRPTESAVPARRVEPRKPAEMPVSARSSEPAKSPEKPAPPQRSEPDGPLVPTIERARSPEQPRDGNSQPRESMSSSKQQRQEDVKAERGEPRKDKKSGR